MVWVRSHRLHHTRGFLLAYYSLDWDGNSLISIGSILMFLYVNWYSFLQIMILRDMYHWLICNIHNFEDSAELINEIEDRSVCF